MSAPKILDARASEGESPILRVAVTPTSCDPDALTVASGRVVFAVHNTSVQAVEWEILDGIMVIDERENIPPGETRSLKVKLSPGDYQITCGLLSNPKGSLHVLRTEGAPAKAAPADLVGPLAEYRVYASEELDGLAEEAGRLADAAAAGDLQAARSQLAAAHAHYARLSPVAVFFPDLDGVADPAADFVTPLDPAASGFRQLEWQLTSGGPHNFRAVAAKLLADVRAMRERFAVLPLTPTPTFAGVTQTVAGNIAGLLAQPQNSTSAADVADLRDYVAGVQTFVDLFQPLVAKTDKPLSAALAGELDEARSVLTAYRTADGRALSPDDRVKLQALTKRLTESLSRIPLALGTS